MSVKYNGRLYTEDEMIHRVWDVEAVMDVMNRRTYYLMQGRRRQELNDLWVTEPQNRKTASLGRNFGYYVGMEEIVRYYVVEYTEKRQEILAAYAKTKPELKCTAENLGIGATSFNATSTPVVEVAEDGRTARGIWYSMAQETEGRPDGSTAIWRCEKVAADLVREADGWRIWHLVISTDFTNPAGVNHEQEPMAYAPGEDPLEREIGSPTIKKVLHDNRYHWSDDYPPMPKPYTTYRDDESYSPQGWKSAILKPSEMLKQEGKK